MDILPEYRGFLNKGGIMQIPSEGTVGYLKQFNPKVRCVYRKGRYYAILDIKQESKSEKSLAEELGIKEYDLHKVNSYLNVFDCGIALGVYDSKRRDVYNKALYKAMQGNRFYQKILAKILKKYVRRFNPDWIILKPGSEFLPKLLKNKLFNKIKMDEPKGRKWVDSTIWMHQHLKIENPAVLEDSTILIIDDFFRTGSHLFSLSVHLRNIPVKKIYAIALAVKNPKRCEWFDWEFEEKNLITMDVDIKKILKKVEYLYLLREMGLSDEIIAESFLKKHFNVELEKGAGRYYLRLYAEDKDKVKEFVRT